MEKPKAVTFDIWSTLVEPNPEPHPTGGRQVSIAEAYGVEPSDEFKKLVRDVSKEFDRESEKPGVRYGCGDRIDITADRLASPGSLRRNGKPSSMPVRKARRAILPSSCIPILRRY